MSDLKKYSLEKEQAPIIFTASGCTQEGIEELLRLHLKKHPDTDIPKLLANLIAMADSVIGNLHERIKLELVVSGQVHPDRQDAINLPSLAGAALGTQIDNDCEDSCDTCAFRHGSAPNQCVPTVLDIDYSDDEETPFYCHDGIEEGDIPTSVCRGWIQQRQNLKKMHSE